MGKSTGTASIDRRGWTSQLNYQCNQYKQQQSSENKTKAETGHKAISPFSKTQSRHDILVLSHVP